MTQDRSIARKPSATVTKTVAMPPIENTALPGSLTYTQPEIGRLPDVINTFADFTQTENCTVNSLELHGPFAPLCETKEEVLEAMTTGGRLGFDAPFSPKGCDMRWFSADEICSILTRFERIFILGDSMMRNVAVALSVILRQDFVMGGRANWVDLPDDFGTDCKCTQPFETRKCAYYSTVSTRVVWNNDPDSVSCSRGGRGGFEYNALLQYPIQKRDMEDFVEHLSTPSPPVKPYAFIMGHGLWNDLEIDKTYAWVDQALEGITKQAPYLKSQPGNFHKLFLGPNAAGIKKPEIFVARQGNIAITKFEKAVAPFVQDRGFDFLGTYNATIQTNNPDGTHGGMKNNLLKAMMVFNWLHKIDTSGYSAT
ncbi:MAG: hypothetical protein Q9162_006811 [Coniocarpon cinnabarinum]